MPFNLYMVNLIDMSLRTTKPDHPRRFRGITLAAAIALSLTGCDSTDHTGGEPLVADQGADREISPPPTLAPPATSTISNTTLANADMLAPGTFDIRLYEGRVTILAKDAQAQDILDDLAILVGFEVLVSGTALERVTLAIDGGEIHAALVELLKPHPYQASYEFDNTRSAYTLTRVMVGHPSTMPETKPAQPCVPGTGSATINMEGAPLPGADQAPLSAEDQTYLSLLLDPSPEVRADAAESIEATGIALDYLARILTTDPSPEVRMATTYSLENSEDPRAVDTLIMGLDDADPEVLVEVIDSLEFLDNRSAIPYLQPLLDHPDEDVRDAAESAIESLQ